MNQNRNLQLLSGKIVDKKKIVSFLYDLARDHLPVGTLETLVRNAQEVPVYFTNGYLAQYAQYLASMLHDSVENSDLPAAIDAYNHASKVINAQTAQGGRACRMAIEAHGDQKYGELPYHIHLAAVVDIARSFSRMVEKDGYYDVLLENGAWLHDTLEDTKLTLNQIGSEFGINTADLVWSVTGEGSNRSERSESILRKLKNNSLGCVLKLADRVANVEQCRRDGSSMIEKYRNELSRFQEVVQPQVPAEAWERLEKAFR